MLYFQLIHPIRYMHTSVIQFNRLTERKKIFWKTKDITALAFLSYNLTINFLLFFSF